MVDRLHNLLEIILLLETWLQKLLGTNSFAEKILPGDLEPLLLKQSDVSYVSEIKCRIMSYDEDITGYFYFS